MPNIQVGHDWHFTVGKLTEKMYFKLAYLLRNLRKLAKSIADQFLVNVNSFA